MSWCHQSCPAMHTTRKKKLQMFILGQCTVEYVEMYLFSAMSTGGSIFDPNPIGPICSDIMNAYYIEKCHWLIKLKIRNIGGSYVLKK